MNNTTDFGKLCRYIWQDHPHEFIAVRVNPVFAEEGKQTFHFASPDGELEGIISISETGIIKLAKRLGYENIRIIKQRGRSGKFVIPSQEQMERDKLLDY